MMQYEVNLTIQKHIYPEFKAWLIKHINEMLDFQGFLEAKVLRPLTTESEMINPVEHLSVQYSVASQADLDAYLTEHAPRMRAEGLDRFGEQFTASRRVLIEQ